MIKDISKNLICLISILTITLFSSNAFAQAPAFGELKITEFVNNVPKTTVYNIISGKITDTESFQNRTYRNASTNQTANISIGVSLNFAGINKVIQQGYYSSVGKSNDPLEVYINSPEFRCKNIATGTVEVKAIKRNSNVTWIKGELTCQDILKKRIAFDYGYGENYTRPPSKIGYGISASSEDSGFEAKKLLGNGVWKSRISHSLKEKLTIYFFVPSKRIKFINFTIRRNFTKISVTGSGPNSTFKYNTTLVGRPNDLAKYQISTDSWVLEPNLHQIVIEIEKPNFYEKIEITDFSITPVEYTPWQNQASNLDVNADGVLSPIDALMVINELNLKKEQPNIILPDIRLYNDDQFHLDVNGDGFITPIDALMVINELNLKK